MPHRTCRGSALLVVLALGACGGDGAATSQGSSGGADTSAASTDGSAAPTTDAPTTGTMSASAGGSTTGVAGSTGPDEATGTTAGPATSEPATGTSTDAVTGTTDGGTSTGADTEGEQLPVLPSAGCGLGGAPTGHQDGLTTVVDGVERSYDLFVPKPYDVDRPHAVIFTYHGVGGTANTNQLKLDTFSAANDGFSINVAPQGWPTAEWNENHFVPFNLAPSLVVFDQVLDKLAAEYCIDLNRVFAVGHSNGGQMAFHLACLRGDRLRAALPSGGRCFSYGPGVCDPDHDAAHQCVGEAFVMSVMGEDDVTRHADEEATLAGFAARQGCGQASGPVLPAPCQQRAGCDAGAEVASCRIPGLAHQIWKDGLEDLYGVMMSL